MSGSQSSFTINLLPPLQSITPGIGRRGTGPFASLPLPQIQAALGQAQMALIAVVTGDKPVTVSYAEGQGHRQVVYNRTNPDQLRMLIRDLEAALGQRTRGAVWPRFG